MPEERRGHRDVRAWNEVVLARAAELQATAEWLAQRQQAAPQPGVDELLADVRAHLAIAEESCRGAARRPWLRFRRRLNGSQARAEEVMHRTVGPGDVPLVLLMGLLGAALASAVTLRHMRGTSTPFAVPMALAVLKLPTGALTALLGLLLMRGEFVPGLTALDTSAQILAWAVGLGYAQQLFTQFVDARGKEVLEDVRGGGRAPTPATVSVAPSPAPQGAVVTGAR